MLKVDKNTEISTPYPKSFDPFCVTLKFDSFFKIYENPCFLELSFLYFIKIHALLLFVRTTGSDFKDKSGVEFLFSKVIYD